MQCCGLRRSREFSDFSGRRSVERRDIHAEVTMEEQPVPRNDEWPWSAAFWNFRQLSGSRFGSVHITYGNRDCCTQCGEMIFADKIACVVTIKHGQKWLKLHFHLACYVVWERLEYTPPAMLADKVVAFPVRQPSQCEETHESQEDGRNE
jgi:hypothetical protein